MPSELQQILQKMEDFEKRIDDRLAVFSGFLFGGEDPAAIDKSVHQRLNRHESEIEGIKQREKGLARKSATGWRDFRQALILIVVGVITAFLSSYLVVKGQPANGAPYPSTSSPSPTGPQIRSASP